MKSWSLRFPTMLVSGPERTALQSRNTNDIGHTELWPCTSGYKSFSNQRRVLRGSSVECSWYTSTVPSADPCFRTAKQVRFPSSIDHQAAHIECICLLEHADILRSVWCWALRVLGDRRIVPILDTTYYLSVSRLLSEDACFCIEGLSATLRMPCEIV